MTEPDLPGAVPPPPPPPQVAPALPPSTSASPTLPEATTQMPLTQAVAGEGQPPNPPPGDGGGGPRSPDENVPWYTRPGVIVGLLALALAVGALVTWLLLRGDDGDQATPDTSRLTIEARDANGVALDRGFLIEVTGPAGSEASYTWLSPMDATPGQITGDSTGADGSVDFEWQPDATVIDPANWTSRITLIESIPLGWTPPGPVVDCALERVGQSDSTVQLAAAVTSSDPAADQQITYTFPNYAFFPGDAVTCELISAAPVETTTTSTTLPATTTTVEPPVTTALTPSTTLPIVTVPPQTEATLWDVIVNSPDLSGLRGLVELAGLEDVLADPDRTLTLLAPSNEAIALAASGIGAPDFTNPSVVEAVLLTHLDTAQSLLIAELFALDPPGFVVANPGPHAVDTTSTPATVGGATVLVADVEAANGVLHVIDRVLLPLVLPD